MDNIIPYRSIHLNEEVQEILNERKGVTNNTSRTIDYIIKLIKDCIEVSKIQRTHPGQFERTDLQKLLLLSEPTADQENNCIVFKYTFSFPKTAITSEWMSDKSIIEIICRSYIDKDAMLKDSLYKGDAISNYRIDDFSKKSIVYLCFTVGFYMYSTNSFYLSGKEYKLNNIEKIKPVIQHEINHTNKRQDLFDSTHNMYAFRVFNAINNKDLFQETRTIGECIYRYCNKTEREAYTEQFYKEWVSLYKKVKSFNRNLNNIYANDEKRFREKLISKTQCIKELNRLKSALILNNSNFIKPDIAKEIYDTFCDAVNYYIKDMKYVRYKNNYVGYVKALINKILEKMDEYYKRCVRSTQLIKENEEVELIEEKYEPIYRISYSI